MYTNEVSIGASLALEIFRGYLYDRKGRHLVFCSTKKLAQRRQKGNSNLKLFIYVVLFQLMHSMHGWSRFPCVSSLVASFGTLPPRYSGLSDL